MVCREQPDGQVKRRVEAKLHELGRQVDVVLSHTCPLRYEPTWAFLEGLDQSTVDVSTEEWLDTIEERLDYQRWYCGHFHVEDRVDRVRIMFEDWCQLDLDDDT